MAAGAVAFVEDAAGGVEFGEGGLEALAGGDGGGIFGFGGDEGLFKRCLTHVVEGAGLVELPLGVSHVPLAGELNEDPFAGGLVGGATELRGEAASVDDVARGKFDAGEFGEGGVEVGAR